VQELIDSIKGPNLRIIGIEEGEEVQAKGIHNIFNKIVTENFPNLEKNYTHSITGGLQNIKNLTKIELSHNILSLKQ
jgi:archaeosine-15-forming tRNA-guanine transglycosylase